MLTLNSITKRHKKTFAKKSQICKIKLIEMKQQKSFGYMEDHHAHLKGGTGRHGGQKK